MNHFTISEDEYNRINAVRGQLGLICGLLCARDANSALFDASDLNDFISAQHDTIRNVVKAVDARYEARQEDGQLNYLHWTYALKIASGDSIHTPNGSEKYVMEGLAKAYRMDADMGHVMELWIGILQKQRPAPMAAAKKPAPRKRDKLAGDVKPDLRAKDAKIKALSKRAEVV
ncbi:MAG: hypothetical protein V4858_03150 [Pseudomonadota bacterium]